MLVVNLPPSPIPPPFPPPPSPRSHYVPCTIGGCVMCSGGACILDIVCLVRVCHLSPVIRQTGYGRKSDIWSVGCVVVEMATGGALWLSDVGALWGLLWRLW